MEFNGRLKKLYDIWSRYFEISVHKNEHLKSTLFFFVLGTYFTKNGMKVLYSGRFNTCRVNLFHIQQSGSGKSEAMKAAHFLMKSLGLDGLYLTKTTDASLIGTINLDNKKNPIIRYGELSKRDYLIWDEGSVLMKVGPYSENLQSIVQQATDDPGYIEKTLANGLIKFTTETSICASSYLEENINISLFKNGCFQRMITSHHAVKDHDIIDFIKNKSKLMAHSYSEKARLMDEFKKELYTIQPNIYKEYNSTRYIDIDMQSMDEICNEHIAPFAEAGQQAFLDNNYRHMILNTFLARNNQIISIGAIVAIINGKERVGKEELLIGFEIWKGHILSANDLLMSKIDKTTVDDYEKRLLVITQTLNNNPKLNKTLLYTKLVELKKSGIWDLGMNNTIKFVKQALSKGDIKETNNYLHN